MNAFGQRTILLALTAYPLTSLCQGSSASTNQIKKQVQCSSPWAGSSSLKKVENMSWKTVNLLMKLFDNVQDWVEWIGLNMPPGATDEDCSHVRIGKELLDGLNKEHLKLEKEKIDMEGELKATRQSLLLLSQENKVLMHRLEASKESGLILDQDRKQLQALLEDKRRLQEENSRIQREIDALQELLAYAAEHAVEGLGSQSYDEQNSQDLGSNPPLSGSDILLPVH